MSESFLAKNYYLTYWKIFQVSVILAWKTKKKKEVNTV